MFQLLPCSVCQRTFSLRKDVADDALLKCPNCGNQFRLGDVLDAFYAPWIVLNESPTQPQPEVHALTSRPGSDTPIGAPTDARLSFDNLLRTHDDTGAEFISRENAVTDDEAEFAADNVFQSNDLELTDAAATDSSTLDSADDGTELVLDDMQADDNAVAINSHQFESPMEGYESTKPTVKKMRTSKSDKGGLWSILQIVLGGAAAIPVTLALLWYVVGKDVMNAGPTVAQYVPWIVPSKFHHPRENIASRPDGPRVPPPELGEGGFRNFDDELGKAAPSSSDPSKPSETEDQSNPSPRAKSPSVPIDGSGMASAFGNIRLIKEKMESWDPTAPDKTARATELFADLVLLSEQLTSFPAGGGAMRGIKNDLDDIGRKLAAEESAHLRRALATLQADQFNGKSKPERPGRIYLGRAAEVSQRDDQWVINVKEGSNQLKIEASKQAVTNIIAGQPFFCLGVVVDESQADSGAPTIVRISANFLQTF